MRTRNVLPALLSASWLGACGAPPDSSSSPLPERAPPDTTLNRPAGGPTPAGSGSVATGPATSAKIADCQASPAPELLPHSLCVCEDLADIGGIVIDGLRPSDNVSMGINGLTRVIAGAVLEGDFIPWGGLDAIAGMVVHGSVRSSGDIAYTRYLGVGGDLAVGGNLSGFGWVDVEGELQMNGTPQTIPSPRSSARTGFPGGAPPCQCTGASDIATAVEAARTQNDNNSVGLGPEGIAQIGYHELVLGNGAYYTSRFDSIGFERIKVEGAASLFIDGDVRAIGYSKIEIADGATLDVYVNGSVGSIGYARIGSPEASTALRVYIGGDGDVVLGSIGLTDLAGAIYAPEATVRTIGATRLYGSLLAGRLETIGALLMLSPSRFPPNGCELPPPPLANGNGVDDPEEVEPVPPEAPEEPEAPEVPFEPDF